MSQAPDKQQDQQPEPEETTGKPWPSVPAPDTEANPGKKVEKDGEPFDGNFA